MYSPQFTITNSVLKYIGVIEAAREIISTAPLVPAWERKFREDAIVRTVHHGTHIEGNELNKEEAKRVIQGEDVIARSRDIQEVINYRNVLRFIDYVGKEKKAEGITELVVKKIHELTTEKILPPEKCGEYRSTQVVIKNATTGAITFRPPPAIEVPFQMEAFLSWLSILKKDELHPVLKAGIIHYEFVRIHPFIDGNGRVGRSLATLSLFLDNYDIRKFFSLEEHYDVDAQQYYDALISAGHGDMTAWLEYFTQGLAIELTRIKEEIQKLSTDMHFKQKLGGEQVFLNERQIKMIEHIQHIGYVQNQSFKELFAGISEDTILRDIHDLIKKGIIKKEGKTKAARYMLRN